MEGGEVGVAGFMAMRWSICKVGGLVRGGGGGRPAVDSCMSAPQMPQEAMGLWVQYTESPPPTTFLLNQGY